MKFSILPLVALASTAAADSLRVQEVCFFGCSRAGTFITDYGRYSINAADGCRDPPVPGMTRICLDWSKSRGHFKFSHQANKRCLRVTKTEYVSCGANTCWNTVWSEVPCTWREAVDEDDEALENVSATTAPMIEATEAPVTDDEKDVDDEVEIAKRSAKWRT